MKIWKHEDTLEKNEHNSIVKVLILQKKSTIIK